MLLIPYANSYLLSIFSLIVGFVCDVLMYANYARCHGLIDFYSTLSYAYTFVLTQSLLHICHSPAFCDLINLCLFTSTLREHTFYLCFAAAPDPKDPSTLLSSW